MGELQCTLEFSLELHKFINVDLFQRGHYQVRSTLKTSPKLPVKIEVNLPKNSTCSLAFPACIVNGTAVSKTFEILYKNEELLLDDIIIFKVHALIEGHRVRETLLKADFQLNVELWFTDQSFVPDQHNSIHCVSTRTLLLHFDPARGLHHHIPLLFDYFHLCAVTITIHASLIALCQPYLRKGVILSPHQANIQKPSKQAFLTSSPRLSNKKSHSNMESVFFGIQVGQCAPATSRLYRARLVHWELCSILLSNHNSLCRKLFEYMTLLPPWQQLKLEFLENSALENTSDFAKECNKNIKNTSIVPPSKEQLFGAYESMDTEEEFLIKANTDIAEICGALILLWQQFLETVVGREKVRQHLSRQRHFQRVKRFSEAFFIIERTRDSALAPCDGSVEAYQEVSECLRKSSYLTLLPPLEVECIEFDGDLNSLPILYEEHYQETARRGSSNSHSSQSESTTSLTDVNFVVEENADCKLESVRRNSQGSLGQKFRSPDISATPTSPSAYSWCPESVTSPISSKSSYLSLRKQSIKDKLLNNFKVDLESDYEEYGLSTTCFTKSNHKINARSKMKLRSKTAKFLRQLKKPQINQVQNSVVLLGVKKLDSCNTIRCGIMKVSRTPCVLENGIRHSQSTLSVMSTLCPEGKFTLPNSGSMPDLSSGFIPPPPPPSPYLSSRPSNSDSENITDSSKSYRFHKVPSSLHDQTTPRRGRLSSPSLLIKPCNFVKSAPDIPNSYKKSDSFQSATEKSFISNFKHAKEKEQLCVMEAWRDPYDEVFLSTYMTKSELKNLHSPSIVSSQPLKSSDKNIFNSNSVKERKISAKKCDKYHPPPLLSIATDGIDSSISSVPSSSVYEICPPSPPVQFKDPPLKFEDNIACTAPSTAITASSLNSDKKSPIKTNDKAAQSWSNDSCLTSMICQGTLFFPKPPAQFGDDIVEQPKTTKTKNGKRRSSTSNMSASESHHNTKSTLSKSKSRTSDDVDAKDVDNIASFFETKCTILEMLSDTSEPINCYPSFNSNDSPIPLNATNERHRSYSLVASNCVPEDVPSVRRASVIGTEMISFVKAKEEFRKQLQYPWLWYSDFPSLASGVPYFQCDSDLRAFSPEGMHLVVCVHGLDGNSADLRLVRTYLELGLPTVNFEFLMSERNQGETFDDFDTMTDRLVSEITYYIEVYGLKPIKISFIGHSLGNIIIRSALTRPEMKPLLCKLHTFLSLSGPHLGTLYNSSGLVNMGMWFMQKWKKSGSLLQLAMKDASDLRDTFLYRLSRKSGLEHFKNILLFGSSQDRYVPLHSARIELCKPAIKDTSLQGVVYREMVTNLIQPIIEKPDISLYRYDVHHALHSSANSLIGRAAHIAVLDSELFIEKFLAVCGLRFFT